MLRRATISACNCLLRPPECAGYNIQTSGVHHHKERDDLQRFLGISRSNKAKANRNTHVNEKMFRRMRGRKTVLLELPEDSDKSKMDNMTPNEIRIELLKKGVNPYKEAQPRVWNEAQITFQSMYGIADPYVAPEKPAPFFGGSDIVDGVKIKADEFKNRLQHKFHNWRNGISRIRKKQGFEKFDVKTFPSKADDIYVSAHKALQSRDKALLLKYITEYAFCEKCGQMRKNGSVVFEMMERVEPSKVVAVRCFDNPPKSGNDIAQLTVRMHTRQKLAIYDRFGRLLLGSENEPKDVVEYVVFENHIAVIDGDWRLHGKIYPSWVPIKQPAIQTCLLSASEVEQLTTVASDLPLRTEEMEKQRKKEKSEDD
ncbi:unnamed protein product [Caenorhabditis auriculariae]|uniref:Large ribosomal subunit protein mL45 n=1 Tax=Caenorhabditis auriculariae TaxID=2777116 RepID=A0A8S1GXQ1_9PELO|nr:unnamed protein product [Caenorhabditis auriculariae]